jgi:hypothetical protein
MLTFFDNQIRPLSKDLDKKLKIKHIKVREDSNAWDTYVPVTVHYKLPNGNVRIMTARYIQEMKHLGVLSR